MRRSAFALGLAFAAFGGSPAMAGGGYCTEDYRPEKPELGCASQIAIAPGNDSRINLFLLVQDRAGSSGTGKSYPDMDWRTFFGRNYFQWGDLVSAWYPGFRDEEPDGYWSSDSYYGTRCQTLDSGAKAYLGRLAAVSGIDADTRDHLTAARAGLAVYCEDDEAEAAASGASVPPADFSIAEGYALYNEASAAFYAGDWNRANRFYGILSNFGRDEWLRETGTYMVARNALNEAISTGFDQWGYFDYAEAQAASAARSEEALRAYLAAFPSGTYAGSASGLIRKALWLQRKDAELAEIYRAMLDASDPASAETVRVIEEIDDKLLVRDTGNANLGAELAAANLLLRMREWSPWGEERDEALTAQALEAQADRFADRPELWSFLKASHAFYVQDDPRAVLSLIPDDAQRTSHSPLNFSRQYLRGLALHATGDRLEASFWLELLEGADGLYQRPAVELALAREWEQSDQLDTVFAENSPITDARIRRILIGSSAGPDLLKGLLTRTDLDQGERDFARFTVLYKQLVRGRYAGFLEDLPQSAPPIGEDGGLWGLYEQDGAPVALFTAGETSDGYPCPALRTTVERLQRDARDVKGRLCLGDWYRLNGFDDFSLAVDPWRQDSESGPAALGDRNYFPGTVIPRHDFYTSIMADRSAAPDDRAYALYRAIRCYAPANSNTCGGEGVEESTRAAWYRRLKSEYGTSRWARELTYYW